MPHACGGNLEQASAGSGSYLHCLASPGPPAPALDGMAFPALPMRKVVVVLTSSLAGEAPVPADVTTNRVTSATQTSSPGKSPYESLRHSTDAAVPSSPIAEGQSTLFTILSALVEGLQDG